MGVKRQKALPAGKYDAGDFSVERLQQYVENTNAAISKGFTVPVIDRHADLENLAADSALRTLGQVKQLFLEDGCLGYEFDLIDDEAEKRLRVLKTSPEFREKRAYNGFGELGPHVRHVALTSKPRNQFQGPFEIVGDGVSRFYEGDEMDEDEEKPGDSIPTEEENTPPAAEETNPDMPKDDKAGQVMEAIVAQMEALGICVPAGWTFESEGAADILLAALKTFQAAKAAAEPEPKEEPGAPDVTESQTPVSFSEEELAALPAPAAAALRRLKDLEARAIQFSEEKAAATRERTISRAKELLRNVPALCGAMLEKLETVQFGEELDAVTAARLEDIELFAKSLPPNLQFTEEGVTVADHQSGNKFFERKPGEVSEEEAEAVVDAMFKRGKA